MIDFDGQFAQSYALPLAATAYNEPWNNPADPILATFTNPVEILVNTVPKAMTFAFGHPAVQPSSNALLQQMLLPKGAPAAGLNAKDVPQSEGTTHADTPTPSSHPAGHANPKAIRPQAIPDAVPIDNRFGWMARDKHRLIVAFRGTQTGADWLRNIDFVPAPYQPIPGRGTVHQGFQQVYYAVRASVLAYVAANQDVTELLVVGHSLGGALATLAIPDLLAHLPEGVAPILYTFAAPRTGHHDFATFLNSRINVAWRTTNVWDVVPHVPPLLAGYIHIGQQLTIDSGFHIDVAENHILPTGYTPGVAAWNEAHKPTIPATSSSAHPTLAPILSVPHSSLRGMHTLAGISA